MARGLNSRLTQLGRRLRRHPQSPEQTPSAAGHGHPRLMKRIVELERTQQETRASLEARIKDVEEGLQESRRLSLRVAELTDLMSELIGAAARGDDEFRRVLDKYAASL